MLGYIFEKYINQKQMGAYYTKEDITEYISKNTVIPFLFDAARAKCKVAFENPDGPTVWDLLARDPDRYIYPAVRHGVGHSRLPRRKSPHGMDTAKPGLIERRKGWNKPAPAEYRPAHRDLARGRRPPAALRGSPAKARQRARSATSTI